ncbi:hypothetical protein Vadar_027012 [Vaccinium darrowii]|uniref:Uncharacterized protein n=1 Tax=Vaccinium darrowii TaxID=229202 RepID=A0ACB7ZP99_9ERIC|nr:hypothetical protein Vadar_027012 [Vaccinium darrowii]
MISLCVSSLLLSQRRNPKKSRFLRSEEDIKLSEAECHLSIIGKVVLSKAISLHGFKYTMAPLCGNPSGFKGVEIGNNLFQFVFGKEENILCVLAGIANLDPNLGLPPPVLFLEGWNKNWFEYGRSLGHCDAFEVDEGEPFWVEFCYEKLPTFCCYCGFLGHEKKSCLKQSQDMHNGIFVGDQYGSWLRVSPSKSSGWRKYRPSGNRWMPTSLEKSSNSKSENTGGNRGGEAVRISNFEQILGRKDFGGVDSQEKIGDTADHGMFQKEISQNLIPANLGSKTEGLA